MKKTIFFEEDYYDLKTFALDWDEDRFDKAWFQLIGVDDMLTLSLAFEYNRL